MPRDALILMTALPPTKGHRQLIEFASNFLAANGEGGKVQVLVCTRPSEPGRAGDRYYAIKKAFARHDNVLILNYHDEPPQNPEDHPDFWNVWKDIVRKETSLRKGDFVIASEMYGKQLADVLECEFIPFNIYRETISISGTSVRERPHANFHHVLPEFQPYLRKTITLFGAESTGKTTMAKRLANDLNGHFVPEWAREYMENFEPLVTDKVMKNIVDAQSASQDAAFALRDLPFIFQDTDLLSTIGYYRIYSEKETDHCRLVYKCTSKTDLYVVMNSSIPFEKDPIRFGGDRRESTDEFWIDLLEEFGAKYHVVQSTHPEDQFDEISEVAVNAFMDNPLFSYVRD